jgi:sugar phosphate isomerase/epimerase
MGLTLSAFADEIDADLQIQMDVLEQYGIDQIDIRSVYGRPIVNYTLLEVEQIREKLKARHFKIAAVGSPIGRIPITQDFEEHFALFEHTLDIAGILETNRIRMFSFFMPPGEDPARFRDAVLDRWHRFLDAAGARGILLMHENKPQTYGDTAARCLDLMQTLASPWAACVFDPANFILSDQDVYAAWQMLRDHVAALHIKDAARSDHHIEPSGMGDAHLPDILADCIQSGFAGICTIEPHLAHSPGMEHLDFGNDAKALPEGGSQQFDIAVGALINLLSELHFDPERDPFKTSAHV